VGLRYVAWIQSASVFSQLSAHKSADTMTSKIEIRFFTDIQSAREWIDGV